MAQTKKSARATMHNWSPTRKATGKKAPAKRAVAKNKSRSHHKKGKKHSHNPTQQATSKSTAIAKHNSSKPAKVSQLSEYRLRGNPGSMSDIGTLGKTAIVGVGGGLTARVTSAVGLGLMDRFGLTGISQNKFATPVGTLAAAWLLVPTFARWGGLSAQSQAVARMGGILFAAADALNSAIGGIQDTIVNKARSIAAGTTQPVLTNGNTAADAVKQLAANTQQAGLDAGLSPEMSAAAAASAAQTALEGLGGLEGIPSVDDVSFDQDYWN